MNARGLISAVVLLCALSPSATVRHNRGGQRTVTDKEIGLLYTQPNGFSWADVGANAASPHNQSFFEMTRDSLKITQSRFHVLKPSDDTSWIWFPYSKMKAFEAREMAAGRPPIFVTATYARKRRPVLWNWSLRLQNGVPTAPSSEWEYAVNVQDDRYIKFWLNNYVRTFLFQGMTGLQNLWIGLDECAFNPLVYGVLDDNNQFISGVTWDAPFPQTEAQYISSINTFFTRVKQLAPDVNLMPNVGTPQNWSDFRTALAASPGLQIEEIYSRPGKDRNSRSKIFYEYVAYSWASSQAKVMLIRSEPPNDPAMIISSVMAYLLMKGPNTFYAPRFFKSEQAIPPSSYSQILAAMGNPVGSLQSQQETGTPNAGYSLYWRQYEGGIVYLNMTGITKTIPLSGQQYYDPNGNPINQITIPDLIGNYVRIRGGGLTAGMPLISPRFAVPVTAPLTVTMTEPSGNSTILYSLDGSIPYGGSGVYSGPITLSQNAIVTARARNTTSWTSFARAMNYTVTSALPQVQFATASDSGSPGTFYPVVSLSSVSSGTISVTYTAVPTQGPTIQRTLTFNPGDLYQWFPLALSSSTTISLLGPQGAVLGVTPVVHYTIQ